MRFARSSGTRVGSAKYRPFSFVTTETYLIRRPSARPLTKRRPTRRPTFRPTRFARHARIPHPPQRHLALRAQGPARVRRLRPSRRSPALDAHTDCARPGRSPGGTCDEVDKVRASWKMASASECLERQRSMPVQIVEAARGAGRERSARRHPARPAPEATLLQWHEQECLPLNGAVAFGANAVV